MPTKTTSPLAKLQAARAKVAELEKSYAAGIEKEFLSLPGHYGYSTMEQFIAALQQAAARKKGSAVVGKKRRRAKITPAMRDQVKDLLLKKMSASKVAKEVGISLGSVNKLKQTFNMTKPRPAAK